MLKVENNPYLAVAQFNLRSTEMNCPLEKPITQTIYSKTLELTISPYVAGGNIVVIPGDTELEIVAQ